MERTSASETPVICDKAAIPAASHAALWGLNWTISLCEYEAAKDGEAESKGTAQAVSHAAAAMLNQLFCLKGIRESMISL